MTIKTGLAAALIALAAGPALAVPQGSAPPYAPPASKRVTVVGTRISAPVGVSDGLQPSDMTRTFEVIEGRSDVGSIAIRIANFASVPKESDAACAFTATASVEFDPTITNGSGFSATDANAVLVPLTFNGARSVTLDAPSGIVTSDFFHHTFRAGQGLYVRLWRRAATAGCRMPVGHYLNASLNEWTNDGFFTANACTGQANAAATAWTCSASTNASPAPIYPLRPGAQTLFSGALGINVQDVSQGDGTGKWSFAGGTGTINYATGAATLTFGAASNAYLAQVRGYGRQTDAPDETLTYGPTDTNATAGRYVYQPSVLLGTYAPYSRMNPFTVCAFGDSIDWGSGNSADYGISWINYALNGTAGLLKVATPSDTASVFGAPATNYRRLNLVQGLCDRAIGNYGTNDIVGSASAASIETSLAATAQAIAGVLPNGAKDLYWATILPRTASATANTPVNAGFGPATVASGSPSTRNAVDAWEFTQIGTLWAGVLDPNALLESGPASSSGAGSGQWSSLGYTLDGIHPLQAGNQLVGNAFKVGGTAPQPAFVLPPN